MSQEHLSCFCLFLFQSLRKRKWKAFPPAQHLSHIRIGRHLCWQSPVGLFALLTPQIPSIRILYTLLVTFTVHGLFIFVLFDFACKYHLCFILVDAVFVRIIGIIASDFPFISYLAGCKQFMLFCLSWLSVASDFCCTLSVLHFSVSTFYFFIFFYQCLHLWDPLLISLHPNRTTPLPLAGATEKYYNSTLGTENSFRGFLKMCDNFVGDYFSFIDCFTQCAQRAHEMLSALSPYLCSLQQLVSSDLQFHMPYNIHLNLFYLSSCQALENCHRFHQKNPANPNCALLQRSRLESRRGANGTGVPTIHKRRKALLLNPKHKVSNEYQTGKGGLTWMPAPSGTVIFQAQFR